MKYFLLAACFLTLGWLSHGDKVELIDEMKTTCSQSFDTYSGPLEERCGKLIDQIQKNDKLEVLSDNKGNFWVESKS